MKSLFSSRWPLASALVLGASLSGFGSSALAQANYGEIDGTVKDATGALIPNAKVTVTDEKTGVSTQSTTTSAGEFRAANLLPATYQVRVEAPGFQPMVEHHLSVTVGRATAAPIVVAVSGTSTAVEVDMEAGSALDTTTQNLTTSIGTEELSVLPTAAGGFGALNIALLAPNVASPGGIGIGTGPSVGGQRPRNNNYTIEGIDDNDKSVTGPIIEVPNDATGDFTLIANQFSPEFGHSSGAQLNTTILSGGNHFHGKLYEYFQNRDLNAASGIAGGKSPNTRFDSNRYGGQIGGPILRGKLFFFTNFERSTTGQSLSYFICTPTAAGITTLRGLGTAYGFRQQNLDTYTTLTPAATVAGGAQVTDANDNACFDGPGPQVMTVSNATTGTTTNIPLGNAYLTPPLFTNTDQTTSSVDYTPSDRNSFRFRYIYFTEGTQDTVASLPQFQAPIPVRQHLASFSWFHNFSPKLVNELRVGFNRESQVFPVAGPSFPGLNAFPNLILYDVGLDIGPDDNAPQFTIQNFYQVVDNLTWTKGRHTLVFGFDGRKYISPQNFVQRQRGDYEWTATDYYLHDLAPDYFGERSAGAQNYAGDQTAFYGYFNDTYRVTSKLTLNYGLRYEFTSVPAGQRQQAQNALASVPGVLTIGAPQPQYTNFAPRVGFAYAPDDKTSIRAGFGLAYDVLFDNLGLLSLPPQFSQTNDVGGVGQPNYLDPNFLANGGLPATLTPITSAAVARSETAAYIPNQVLPYSETYSLTIQRNFFKNYTAEIQYLGTRGIHLPIQAQLNKTPKVTAANQLTTYPSGTFSTTTDATTGYTYAVNAGSTAKLSNITALSAIVPGFSNAGFTSTITSYQPYGASNYNGLGLNLTRRFVGGLQLNASYTYSRAMDDSTAEVAASDLTQRRPENSQNIHQEYSRSALDRPNRFTFEAVYDLPYFKHSNFLLRNLLGNWEVAPIYTYESGEYVTPSSEANSNLNGDSAAISRTLYFANAPQGTGSGVYPVFNTATPTAGCLAALAATATANGVAAASAPTSGCASQVAGYQAITNARYVTAGPGTLPTAERNTLPGRPIDNLTMTAGKRIAITERYSFEFQAMAYNVFNHAQYVPGATDSIGSTSTIGVATNYLDPARSTSFNAPQKLWTNHARSMQLSAKLNF